MKVTIKNNPIIFYNKDFQTIQIKVIFPFYRKEEDIAKMNLLPNLLHFKCEKYPTEEKLITECDKKYILASFCSCSVIGNIGNFTFNFMIPDTKTLPNNLLDEQFQIFHEMIYHPKLKNDEFCNNDFKLEITNLKNNIDKSLKETSFYAMIKAKEIVDTKNTISSTIYNHQEQIEELTPKNLYQFYLSKIKNNQPIIYIFGNVDKKQILHLCQKYLYQKEYKPISYNMKLRNYLPIRKEIKDIQEKSSFHNSVLISFYKVKNMKRKDEVYLGIIKELLSSSSSRILNKKLRDETDLVYSTTAFNYSNYGLLGICSMIHKNNIELVKKKTEEAILELSKEDIIEPLLNNIKEKHRVNLLRLLDNKTMLFQEKLIKNLKIDITSKEYYEEILPITTKDIKKFMKRITLDTYYFLEEGNHE